MTDAGPRRLAKPLFDSLLIVFGVVLGFVVNDWAQTRAQHARTAQALSAIRQELVADRRELHGAHEHHLGVHDTLAAYVAREVLVPERVYMSGMFSPGRPVSAAWESARTTGVLGDLPYPLVLRLSDVYGSVELYRSLSEGIAHDLYTDFLRRGPKSVFGDAAPNFGLLAGDWAQREARLTEKCDSAIALIDRAQDRAPTRPP